MEATFPAAWHPFLQDPTGRRAGKPRTSGKTMVIDKGLGLRTFEDLLESAANYIDILKIGFGTSSLYPLPLLKEKIELAKRHHICIIPGGTFLEVAVAKQVTGEFFRLIAELGFSGVEISDGTIRMDRMLRDELIAAACSSGLRVFTEYGKKCFGSRISCDELVCTVLRDLEQGAELVTVEGRESGAGVGIYDEKGACRDEEIEAVMERIPNPEVLLWEAPQKSQQVHLIKLLGAEVNLGNIAPQDIYAVEALRRGLRSDTFVF